MRHRMAAWVRLACGVAAFALLRSLATAQQPATDGMLWKEGFPVAKNLQMGTFYHLFGQGLPDSKKYPQLKVDNELVVMEIEQYLNGKAVAGTKTTHHGKADKASGAFEVDTKKQFKNGKQEDFGGVPGGDGVTYKVKVQVKVKDTPTSGVRDAYLEGTVTPGKK